MEPQDGNSVTDTGPPAGIIRYSFEVAKSALVGLFGDKCLRSSAALSFYALFSMAPMVYLAVYIASLLAADVDFQHQITDQFSSLLGDKAAEGMTVLLDSLETEKQSRFQLLAGLAVLAFSATNIFVQVQGTFNEIFGVQPRTGAGLIKQVIDRVISLGIILSLGFLLIISLVLDSFVIAFSDYLFSVFNDAALIVVQLLQTLLLVTLVTGVIYAMFEFLPDVYLQRRHKIIGSVLVAGMLLLGKYAISVYIGSSRLSELGGASASVIVLMLWIYYTSLILFLGAEVIKAVADVDGAKLIPRRYATRVRKVVISETDGGIEKAE